MAPPGSRTTIWPYIFIAGTIAILLMLTGFHSQLMSALHDFTLTTQNKTDSKSPSKPFLEQFIDPSQYNYGLPRTSTVFRQRPVIEDLSTSADKAWQEMVLTRKGGFLWVEHNQTAQYPYGISMFHGLHCLQMLRIALRDSPMMQSVVEQKDDNAIESETKDSKMQHPSMNPLHVGHCIGYIAQQLMCAADSTIEPPKMTLDEHGQAANPSVDGEGYQHQCRDSSLLWEIASNSEETAAKPWDWQEGDTVESVFGASKQRNSR